MTFQGNSTISSKVCERNTIVSDNTFEGIVTRSSHICEMDVETQFGIGCGPLAREDSENEQRVTSSGECRITV